MDPMISAADVHRLYRQWQDGKLLDTEERNALRADAPNDKPASSFAVILKSATESPSAS